MRVLFNEGQEVTRQDLNNLQINKEREFYDRIIYEMLGRNTDAFFEGSFKVTYVDSNTVQVAKGFGFQEDVAQVSPEPTIRPIYLDDDTNIDITAPHGSNPRIDLVCVKADRVVTESETRRYKATLNALPSDTSFDVETDWEADIVITPGTPAGSPAEPAVPAGYIKIAALYVTAITGIANQAAITDTRDLLLSLPRIASPYQAIVGTETYCTHETLEAAIDAVAAGSRILIVSNIDVATAITIDKNNLQIESLPGVDITEDGAATGLIISAAGVRLKGLRLVDFTTAIEITDTYNNNFITECRFNNCTTEIDDLNTTPNNVALMNLTE